MTTQSGYATPPLSQASCPCQELGKHFLKPMTGHPTLALPRTGGCLGVHVAPLPRHIEEYCQALLGSIGGRNTDTSRIAGVGNEEMLTDNEYLTDHVHTKRWINPPQRVSSCG